MSKPEAFVQSAPFRAGETEIDEAMAFKQTMTSDLKSVTSLSLIAERITHLNYGNVVLSRLPHLLKLDLSGNKIQKIQNLDGLKNLQYLGLSGNLISDLENLNLPQLKSLIADNCKIARIENLKNCKKLQTLSLSGNAITDPSL